jgi:GNAT superfamily N-acetyltransferase
VSAPTTVIRDARPVDLPALRSVFERASLSNAGDRAALRAHPEALEFPWPTAPSARCRVAVAVPDAGVVGFATTTEADGVVELVDLFVDPDHMRQGVARSLVDDVVAWARATGARRIGVDGNPHARGFYEAVGFVVEGEVSTEFGPGLRLGFIL